MNNSYHQEELQGLCTALFLWPVSFLVDALCSRLCSLFFHQMDHGDLVPLHLVSDSASSRRGAYGNRPCMLGSLQTVLLEHCMCWGHGRVFSQAIAIFYNPLKNISTLMTIFLDCRNNSNNSQLNIFWTKEFYTDALYSLITSIRWITLKFSLNALSIRSFDWFSGRYVFRGILFFVWSHGVNIPIWFYVLIWLPKVWLICWMLNIINTTIDVHIYAKLIIL